MVDALIFPQTPASVRLPNVGIDAGIVLGREQDDLEGLDATVVDRLRAAIVLLRTRRKDLDENAGIRS